MALARSFSHTDSFGSKTGGIRKGNIASSLILNMDRKITTVSSNPFVIGKWPGYHISPQALAGVCLSGTYKARCCEQRHMWDVARGRELDRA